MESCPRPAPGEGGAAAQVEQVENPGSSVSHAAGSDCSLASRGGGESAVSLRIQLWEARFDAQTLPRSKAMEEEGVRNFKELRARFQKFDAPTLPRPIKFPAGVSQKGDMVCTQSTQILANGKPLSCNPSQPSSDCCSGESLPLKTQKTKLAPRSETHKCSSSPGPPEKSAVCTATNSQKSTVCTAASSQKASLLSDVTRSNTEIMDEEKVKGTSSFRNKLWNWEKVSSQKSEMSSSLVLANHGSKAFHVEGQKSMGLAPERTRKKLETKGTWTLPSQRHSTAQRKSVATSEDPSPLLSQHGRKSQENPSPERSQAGSACQPVYECELPSLASENQPDVRHHQRPKTKPLPSIESLGPPPPKPSRPPVVNLQAFQRQPAAIAKTQNEVTVHEGSLSPEGAEFEEPHNYEATISYPRHSGNSINLCTAKEIADSTYEVEIEELQKPWKSFLHQELSPNHEDKKLKGKEPGELEPQKTEKDPHSNHPFKVGFYEGTPAKIQTTRVHRDRRSTPAGKQETRSDICQMKVCPEDMKLASHSEGQSGYVEALEVTKDTLDPGDFKSSCFSEETYDDVEYPRTDEPRSDLFSSSFTSDSEESNEEMYEDIYKTKRNYPKIDLDGKEALRRLQRFFKKEKDRFKIKKTKSKENVSAFSISLPDLELRSQEVMIYDDVERSEKESKDEDKMKAWTSKFLISKGKKERKGGAEGSESFSPINFFRTKMQNLEKNRMGREEKLFRERFQYDKEIIIINKAVACSKNSRNGIFDLPITPGEELEVIDTTEQNLVICRNSKGKYGYVLIEHLNFKHQGWSH